MKNDHQGKEILEREENKGKAILKNIKERGC